MKVAVAVPEIVEFDMERNFEKILSYIDDAIMQNVELLLFPEAVLTGLIICDDHKTDIDYAVPITSPYIARICEKAREGNIWVAVSFLECDNIVIYDSAVLINNTGECALHYRRMSPGWCSRKASLAEYGYGNAYTTAETPWGKVGFLICGDLFQITQSAIDEKLDLLLFPFARCFSPKILEPQREWDDVEWPLYAEAVAKVNAYTLMANYIAPACSPSGGGFGGGFVAGKNGELLASLPLNQAGLLLCEIGLDRA